MFVGHYAGAFLARAWEPRLPLGAAFICAQLVDFGWDALVLAGIERARIVPGLASNPLDLYYMPYTHSLLATVVWAGGSFAIVKLTKMWGGSTRVALAAAGAVASHWVGDLLVHRADLPLMGDLSPKLGFGLWDNPVLALAVEIGVLAASVAVYLRSTGEDPRWWWGVTGFFSVLQIGTVYGPIPPTIPAMICSLLAAYLLFAWAANNIQGRAAVRA